ncbi:MAG: hypothetical protein WCB51_04305 [Candidatus Dormiibacterota bacterium]
MTNHLDRIRNRSRAVGCIATAGAAAALLAACGATTSPGSLSLPTLPAGIGATPSGAVGPTSGNLGDTLAMMDGGDDIAHVTLLKVFDPVNVVDPNDTPPDGTRWVGFEGTIVIDGSRSGEDSTAFDVIGSDGQTYGADTAYHIGAFDGCTDTGIDVPSGATQTFCAGVGLPPGVTVAKVGYSTEGVDGHAPAKLFWTVTDSGGSGPTATPEATPTDTPESTPTATPGS